MEVQFRPELQLTVLTFKKAAEEDSSNACCVTGDNVNKAGSVKWPFNKSVSFKKRQKYKSGEFNALIALAVCSFITYYSNILKLEWGWGVGDVMSDFMYAAAASYQAEWFRAKILVTFRHNAAKGQTGKRLRE